MKTKVIVIGLIVVVGFVVAGVLRNHQPAPEAVSVKAPTPVAPVRQALAPSAPTEIVAVEPATPTETPQPAKMQSTQRKVNNQMQQPTGNQQQGQLQDPDARVALALVGTDPDAESYWLDAIFDSNLPDEERSDLMEDLNEMGFANPKQLTSGDLPLILSRLAIVDQVAPYADDFMAPHLAEAYKDLVNMANKAAGY